MYLACFTKKARKTCSLWDLINPLSLKWVLNEGFLLVVFVLVWLLTEWLHTLPDDDTGKMWLNYVVHALAIGYAPFLVDTLYTQYIKLFNKYKDEWETLEGKFEVKKEEKRRSKKRSLQSL